MDTKTLRRFLPKIHFCATGCWEWIASLTPAGYGQFRINQPRRQALAHMLTYEHWIGPIPEGLELDHRCRNRACCNPAHLEAVTHAENMRRGLHSNGRAEMTHCSHGHEFTTANTLISKTGGRNCRACCRDKMRRRRAAGQNVYQRVENPKTGPYVYG